ncbi:MAG: HEAT repeat domain-containing protein, partial [Deltaproteobacteria bacterium]
MYRAVLSLLVCCATMAAALAVDEPASPIKRLIGELQQGDESARGSAAWKLGRLGAMAREAEPQLVRALNDDESFVRSDAAEALLRVGGDPKQVKRLLHDPENSVRLAVAEALLAQKADVDSVTPVLLELRRPYAEDLSLGFDAACLMQALNPTLARRMQTLLVHMLPKGEDEEIRDAVMASLADLGPLDPMLVPQLAAFLKLPHRGVQLRSAALLMEIGPAAKNAVPRLRTLAAGSDAELALASAAAVAAISDERDDCVERLSEAVTETNPAVRSQTAKLLARLGPRAAGAIPGLIAAMTDGTGMFTDDGCRRDCGEALRKIGKPAVAALIEAIGRCRGGAPLDAVLETLQDVDPEAQPAIPALVALLTRDVLEPDARVQAIRTLASIGPREESAIPAFLGEFESTDAEVRAVAAAALGKTGSQEKNVRERLHLGLVDASGFVRLRTGVALVALGDDSRHVFPMLVALIDEGDVDLCATTLGALR